MGDDAIVSNEIEDISEEIDTLMVNEWDAIKTSEVDYWTLVRSNPELEGYFT